MVDQKFPSCVWTGEDMCTFIRDHLGPLLAAKRRGCEIWLGTLNTSDFDSWAGAILSAPRGLEYVKGIGYQWNGKSALQRTHDAYPDVPMIQTENECGDGKNSWKYACEVFDLVQHYIRNGVVAYVYWNMVLKPGGSSTWGWRQNSMVTVDPDAKLVTYNHEYYVMKHFSRFIDPGAVRLATTGPWAPHSVAFENPPSRGREGDVVVVVRNPFGEPWTLALNDGAGAVSVQLGPSSISSLVFAASEKGRRTVAVRSAGKAKKAVRKGKKGPKKRKKRRGAKRR